MGKDDSPKENEEAKDKAKDGDAPEGEEKKKKSKLGLIIFLVVTALLASSIGAGLYSINPYAKKKLTEMAQEAFGAKVEIGRVKVGLFPFSLKLEDVRVADAERPGRNLFEMSGAEARVALAPLFQNRSVIIDNLEVQDFVMDTPRKTSGELADKEKKTGKKQTKKYGKLKNVVKRAPKLTVSGMKDVNVEKLVNEESLYVNQQLNGQYGVIRNEQRVLEQKIKRLNFKERYGALKSEINSLMKADNSQTALEDVPSAVKGVEIAMKNVKSLQDDIKEIDDAYQESLKKIEESREEIEELKQGDYDRLASRLNVGTARVSKVSGSLMQDRLYNQTVTAVNWIERLKRIANIERASEERKEKKERKKTPSFWAKKIKFSGGRQGNTSLVGEVSNLTTHQELIDKPTTANLSLNFPHPYKLDVESVVDMRKGKEKAVVKGKLSDAPIYSFSLVDGNRPVTIRRGKVNGEFNLESGANKLKGDYKFVAKDLDLKKPKPGDGMDRMIIDSLSKMPQVDVKGRIRGSVLNPRVSVSSNLDREIGKFAKKMASSKQSGLEKELVRVLDARNNRIDRRMNKVTNEFKTAYDNGLDRKKIQELEDSIAQLTSVKKGIISNSRKKLVPTKIDRTNVPMTEDVAEQVDEAVPVVQDAAVPAPGYEDEKLPEAIKGARDTQINRRK